MILNIIFCLLIFCSVVLLAWLLGKYLYRVYSGEHSKLTRLSRSEEYIVSFCGVASKKSCGWKEYLILGSG
ncbi:MAG: potassium-transporting ATPase subunit KdpA [Gemmatimonadaceae bacterium]|nr:potassium-transporting ATPase subunit KdpA [Chitinophagaceae bacterium]